MVISPEPNVSFIWRAMREDDLDVVNHIAGIVHVDYPESPTIFAERLSLFAQGCWIAERIEQGTTQSVGYAITHPGIIGQPPALDSLLHQLPEAPDCLYLHDVALLEAARQGGLGAALVVQMKRTMSGRNLKHAALIAVNGSATYWQRRGFEPLEQIDASLQRKLAGYDSDARYMLLKID